MNTNANLIEGSPLHVKGHALIEAAHAYWKEYQKHFTRGAVVFLETG